MTDYDSSDRDLFTLNAGNVTCKPWRSIFNQAVLMLIKGGDRVVSTVTKPVDPRFSASKDVSVNSSVLDDIRSYIDVGLIEVARDEMLRIFDSGEHRKCPGEFNEMASILGVYIPEAQKRTYSSANITSKLGEHFKRGVDAVLSNKGELGNTYGHSSYASVCALT